MSRPLSFAALAVAGASLAGCWFFAPTTLDGFAEASIRARCHFAFACCSAAEREQFQNTLTFKDEGTCVQESLDSSDATNGVIARAKAVLAANTGTFDQKRADECEKDLLDAENACKADVVLGGGRVADGLCAADEARGFVTGTVADGDKCNDDIECADYGVCDRSGADANTVTTEGKCKAAKKEGAACDGAGDFCAPGLSCTFDQNGKSTCQKPDLLDDGAQCFDGSQCKGGFCTEKTVKVCAFQQTPCAQDADCAATFPGDTCDGESTTAVCGKDGPVVDVCKGQ